MAKETGHSDLEFLILRLYAAPLHIAFQCIMELLYCFLIDSMLTMMTNSSPFNQPDVCITVQNFLITVHNSPSLIVPGYEYAFEWFGMTSIKQYLYHHTLIVTVFIPCNPG